MMNKYTEQMYYRDTIIDELGPWMWQKSDEGAWVGPHAEWIQSHKDGYLRYCRAFDTVVQAGGNHGLYPRLFAPHFRRVFTFEPDPRNFHCLVNNNQLAHVFKFQAALGAFCGFVGFDNANFQNTGTHTINLNVPPTVQQLTIDSLNLEACDLIQLDIEGYEGKAIEGALKTIEKFKPVVSCERNDGGHLAQFGYQQMAQVGSDIIYAPVL